MIPAVRRERIKQRLLENKSVTVNELSSLLNVSEETIRRDLQVLENKGVAQRTHGGAIIAERVSSVNTYNDLKEIFKESKKIMASRILDVFRENICIYLDSSTTSLAVAEMIPDISLTVVSNSLEILHTLSTRKNINLIAVGGSLSRNGKCFVGRQAINTVEQYYFDIVVMSCRTLSLDEGITDSYDDEVEVKAKVIGRSHKLYLLADHSKLDKVSFVRIADLSDIDVLVTDNPLSQKWTASLQKLGVSYIDTDEHDEIEE